MTRAERDYFDWLTQQIVETSRREYFGLFRLMYRFEYVWTVPHDDNRCQDAKDLRTEYINEYGPHDHSPWHDRPVSVLEVLISLSRHLSFHAGGDARRWAWELIKNLGLERMHDPLDMSQRVRTEEILNDLVWRTYSRDGRGGFFPLENPRHDQRKVELWYQMNEYIDARQSIPGS